MTSFFGGGITSFYKPAVFLQKHPIALGIAAACLWLFGHFTPRFSQKLEPRAPKVVALSCGLYVIYSLLCPVDESAHRADSLVAFLSLLAFALYGLVYWLEKFLPDLTSFKRSVK